LDAPMSSDGAVVLGVLVLLALALATVFWRRD